MELEELKLLDKIEDCESEFKQSKNISLVASLLSVITWSGFVVGIISDVTNFWSDGASVGLIVPSFILGIILTAITYFFMFELVRDDKKDLKNARREYRDYQIKYYERNKDSR